MTRCVFALETVMNQTFALQLSDNLSGFEGKLHLHLCMSWCEYQYPTKTRFYLVYALAYDLKKANNGDFKQMSNEVSPVNMLLIHVCQLCKKLLA